MNMHTNATAPLAAAAKLAAAVWRHPANQDRKLQALARSVAWQVRKRAFGGPAVIPFHGQRLKCYPDSTVSSAALYFSGLPDYWEMKFMRAYLRPGDNFIDVGANVGVYSILAASCIKPQGQIDAFEPLEQSAARIEEQALLNQLTQLRVHRLATGKNTGLVDFGFSDVSATMHMRRNDETEARGCQVRSVRLDDFEPYCDYTLGKMDIEGAEPMALAGAARRLRDRNPPVWLLELAGYSTCYGISSDEVVRMLADAGYDCAIYQPSSRSLLYTSTPWNHGVQNVLAVAREHRHFVRDRLSSAEEVRA